MSSSPSSLLADPILSVRAVAEDLRSNFDSHRHLKNVFHTISLSQLVRHNDRWCLDVEPSPVVTDCGPQNSSVLRRASGGIDRRLAGASINDSSADFALDASFPSDPFSYCFDSLASSEPTSEIIVRAGISPSCLVSGAKHRINSSPMEHIVILLHFSQ